MVQAEAPGDGQRVQDAAQDLARALGRERRRGQQVGQAAALVILLRQDQLAVGAPGEVQRARQRARRGGAQGLDRLAHGGEGRLGLGGPGQDVDLDQAVALGRVLGQRRGPTQAGGRGLDPAVALEDQPLAHGSPPSGRRVARRAGAR
ncbi:MAG: hypothetical protein KF878_09475 [Planctomycetes bacterium]|nr:hypothetical protein [Planctomycetota bacterium]